MENFLKVVLLRRKVILVVKAELRTHIMEGQQKQLKLYI